jgi:hypothetical protein
MDQRKGLTEVFNTAICGWDATKVGAYTPPKIIISPFLSINWDKKKSDDK